MTDYKQIIIDALDVMRKKEVAEKQTFKARAYEKVLRQLKDHKATIQTYADVEEIQGIGEQISNKIKEILETGTLKSAEKVKQNYNIDALDAFQGIYGVGSVKANQLVSEGITSIAQLRIKIKETPSILNEKQTIGLKYYEDLLERIPRDEMEEHRDTLYQLLPHEAEQYHIELVGSFRRGVQTSGDVDALIQIPPDITEKEGALILKQYVKILETFGYIEEVLALGDKKCMAISRIYNGKARRLDILMTPYEEYPYALLYFTGSDKFNVAFRQHALDKGYTLNEHSLTPIRQVRTPPSMTSEKDIFHFLTLRYIEPEERVDAAQIKKRVRPTIIM